VQAALGVSAEIAADGLTLAGELAHRLPDTLAFLESGELSTYQARTRDQRRADALVQLALYRLAGV
jgi:hypothetical protein